MKEEQKYIRRHGIDIPATEFNKDGSYMLNLVALNQAREWLKEGSKVNFTGIEGCGRTFNMPNPEGVTLSLKGHEFLEKGDYKSALGQFLKVEKWYKQSGVGEQLTKAGVLKGHLKILAEVENNIGYCLLKLGRYESALTPLLNSLEKHEAEFVNNNIADCYMNMENKRLARRYYSRELAINPTHPTAKQSLEQLANL